VTIPDVAAHDHDATPPGDAGYEVFTREKWAALAHRSGTNLSAADARKLAATGEPMSRDEVGEIYLPLAQLLALMAEVKHNGHRKIASFLGHDHNPGPFIIGIAGGVAVGKSTTARVLQAVLQLDASSPTVDLLTTDGFLYPNDTLEARGLMARKGFPESYDQRALIEALAAIRGGAPEVRTPVYSHVAYDIVPGEFQLLRRPDIVIVEGLNVLQVNTKGASPDHVVVSDFFDVAIYVDAAEMDVADWYLARLMALRSTVMQEPDSYFHRFASMSDEEMSTIAQQVWEGVNLVNLRENIAPTRGRAHLVLEKNRAHLVDRVLLRLT
jgi:type I pantothenate kinase